ncbi:uncharacterized protein TNCV_3939651 [Trichonephila clavipes]|uniref:Uncharacterized protein n=1 Tax=Trichonephila clavipes TaxID=2585209 RepID=A0A8X7B9S1_TRICX|nr:uncharacterized protein TNCV_3939651 [Trichonephila clavipes]
MAPHTLAPAVCRCKAKAGLRCSPRGLHTRTRWLSVLKLNLNSSLKTTWFHSTAVQYRSSGHHSKRRRRLLGVIISTRNGRRVNRCPSARRFAMIRKDTVVCSEGATCVWTVSNEAVGSSRACHKIRWPSRRLVCRGCPEPGRRVNEVSSVHWFQNLLAVKSERST